MLRQISARFFSAQSEVLLASARGKLPQPFFLVGCNFLKNNLLQNGLSNLKSSSYHYSSVATHNTKNTRYYFEKKTEITILWRLVGTIDYSFDEEKLK